MSGTGIKGDPDLHTAQQGSSGVVFRDVDHSPICLDGFPWRREGGEFFRLPYSVKAVLREDLAWVAYQPAGGVIRFRSDTRRLFIRAKLDRDETFRMHPRNLESGFDVYVGVGGEKQFNHCICPDERSADYLAGLPNQLPRGEKEFTIYTPLLNPLLSVEVGLGEGRTLLPPTPYSLNRPILFYGSSITQGFCASRPGLTYPARICRELNAPMINLGLAGNAKGDLQVAEAIAQLDLACLVIDYDFNSPSSDHLRKTHAPFFKLIRATRHELPVVFVTAPWYRSDPVFFGRRAKVIMETYEEAKSEGDDRVYLVHGKTLAPDDWREGTVDCLHPNDVGFKWMAEAIGSVVKQAVSPSG